jgi:hypothetical protein
MGVANDNCCVCGGGGGTTDITDNTTATAATTTTTTTTESMVDDDFLAALPDDGGVGGGGVAALDVNGTCGNGGGDRGNGICADGTCCSKFGWCGETEAHCDGTTLPPTMTDVPTTFVPPSPAPSPPAVADAPDPIAPTPPPYTFSPVTEYPTSYLHTVADWDALSYSAEVDWSALTPGHTRFCGPKLVGGYDKARAMCSPLTECGKARPVETHFGSSGNDCPDGLMCFADIECPGPSAIPSISPSTTPTTAFPTYEGQTRSPTSDPTASEGPTRPPASVPPDAVTSRGSYCGYDHGDALSSCSVHTRCAGDGDCNGLSGASDGWGAKGCHAGISCTVTADELAELSMEELNDYSDSESSISGGGMLSGRRRVGAVVVACGGMAVSAIFFGNFL